MGDHWPLVVASGLIALAAALGLWQHDHAVELAAKVPPVQTAAAPAPAVAQPAPEKADPAPTPLPLPSAPAATRTPFSPTPTAPTAPVVTPRPLAPAPAAPATAHPAAPTAPATLPAGPTAPAIAQNPAANAAPPVRQGRNATLAALRTELQAHLNLAPMDTAGGGFALAADGARLEVKSPPNWNITIYNVNPKTPDIETEKFKEMLKATIASLQIDMAPKPIESANGKLYLKTSSKLGSISLIRDPANGNSCVIGPIQQWVAPPVQAKDPNQPAAAPGAPAAPVRTIPEAPRVKAPKTPAAPPRPPATDANF